MADSLQFSDLINRVIRELEESPTLDTLKAAATAAATSISVNRPRLFSKGTDLEINDELMVVTADPSGFSVPVDRAVQGTTAAAHSEDDQVRVDPRYKRANIKEAINVTLNNWISSYMPELKWDTSTAGNFLSHRWIYELPAEATKVHRVVWKVPGYEQLRTVKFGQAQPYPTDITTSGLGFEVYDMGLQGRAVQVLYERAWERLEDDTDTIPSTFPAMADELIIQGAALYLNGWRLQPSFRIDEAVFTREQSESTPANINVAFFERMRRDWIDGMRRAMSQRPAGPHPRKVWVGKDA